MGPNPLSTTVKIACLLVSIKSLTYWNNYSTGDFHYYLLGLGIHLHLTSIQILANQKHKLRSTWTPLWGSQRTTVPVSSMPMLLQLSKMLLIHSQRDLRESKSRCLQHHSLCPVMGSKGQWKLLIWLLVPKDQVTCEPEFTKPNPLCLFFPSLCLLSISRH